MSELKHCRAGESLRKAIDRERKKSDKIENFEIFENFNFFRKILTKKTKKNVNFKKFVPLAPR